MKLTKILDQIKVSYKNLEDDRIFFTQRRKEDAK